jgi:hypothetical protein
LEGKSAKKMRFEHGEIVTSPDQGANLLVAGYQHDNNIIVNWGDTAPFTYDMFIVRWDKDGQNVGEANVRDFVEPTNGFYRVEVNPTPGQYSIIVEGSKDGDREQGWTLPVNVTYVAPPLVVDTDCAIQPIGLIRERWIAYGAKSGPFGCPTAPEQNIPERNGRTMPFENGEIIWSPDQGPNMVLAVYQARREVVVNWGNTAPFHYLYFIVRVDFEGQYIGQIDVAGSTAGTHTIPEALGKEDPKTWPSLKKGAGRYSVIVEGCEAGGLFAGADCEQRWTAPASVNYTTTVPKLDFSSLLTPRTFGEALQDKDKRALLAANFMANQPNISLAGKWGDGEVTRAIAMLYIIADAVAQGKSAAEPRRFGQPVGMLTEINNAIRSQVVCRIRHDLNGFRLHAHGRVRYGPQGLHPNPLPIRLPARA